MLRSHGGSNPKWGTMITASAIVHARREAEQLRRMIAEIGPGDDIARALAYGRVEPGVTLADIQAAAALLRVDISEKESAQ